MPARTTLSLADLIAALGARIDEETDRDGLFMLMVARKELLRYKAHKDALIRTENAGTGEITVIGA